MRASLALACLLTIGAFAGALPTTTPSPAVTSWIVGFHGVVPPDLFEGAPLFGGLVERIDEPLAFAVVLTADADALRAAAVVDDRVRYVEWNDPRAGIASYVPNDAQYGAAGHYGSKKIGAEKAWDRTLGTTAVKVAIVDSGLHKTHEEFAASGRIAQGWDFVQNDNTPQDACGHGTHVAGTIGAQINNAKGIAGMAQAYLIPIRALTNDLVLLCSGSAANLASALRYGADQGAHLSSNSWGGGGSTGLTDAINYANTKGTMVVAAAGNDGSCTNCVSEPWKANAAKVLIVSSTDQNDALSSFSSQGPQVDVAAPGTSILSATSSSNTAYATMSGTSMATPHVTGALALVKTLNPGFTIADLENRIRSTAVDLGSAGKDDRFGYGRINADAATAGGTPPPPPGNNAPTAAFTSSTSGLTVSVNGGGSSDSDGTIAAYSWNWGDGTAAGSGVAASHTYAAGGTYTVTLTVTDDDGATDTESRSVTVASSGDPDPGASTLTNGVAKSDTSGGEGSEKFYKILVPAGRSSLSVVLDGPACSVLSCAADLDLYVKRGVRPTDAVYDCRPFEGDSDETCSIANPAGDWWYIRVKVFSGSSGAYTIRATY